MENRNDILVELQRISPVIAGMVKTNVFTVPEGYFETLDNTILTSINDGVNIEVKNNSDIPQGYFDNLAASILDNIKNEETESSLLKSIQHKNTFEVPQGYFDNLSASVLNKINIASLKETEEFSEVLNSIGKKNIFEVPQGYFETLPLTILGKVQPQATKVVSMRSWTRIFKYAAAAMVTGVLALGVYKYTNNTPLNIEPPVIAKLDPIIEKGKAMNDEKFEEALNNLSETDIAKYLENTSTEADVSVLMSGVEENNLPNQEDYLTDEKTLENFLKDIDTQKLNN